MRSTQKGSFTRVASILSVAGLAVGIAALLITLFILNGFERVISQKISEFDGHIRIRHFLSDPIQPHIAGFDSLMAINSEGFTRSGFVQGSALLRKGKSAEGVIVEGLETLGGKFIQNMLVEGSANLEGNQTIIGQSLADQFRLTIGDKIVLFDIATLQTSKKRLKQFVISGLFHSGMTEYDNSLVFTSIQKANELFAMEGKVSGHIIRLNDHSQYKFIAKLLEKTLAYPYMVITWKEKNQTLFRWMDVQRLPILFIFSLIALVGFVNIISALAMIIIDKTRQIGLLKSLGLSKGKLYQVFLIKGLIIGAAGSLGGSLLAVLLALLQNNFKLITVPEDVYFMDFIPIDVNAPDILLISVLASLASVFAALWPTFRSGQIQPADALKYE